MRKIILFDCDDTLLDFHGSEAAAIRKTLRQFGLPWDDAVCARYSDINAEQWRLFECGEIAREDIFPRRFNLLLRELGSDLSGMELQRTYEHLLSLEHDYLPGAEALLERLLPDYELYLVSNGTTAVQDRRIADSGMGRFFRAMFVSERVGANKPSPVFFDRVFAAIPGARREDAIIVGDSLTSDILGGLRSGIPTVWFNPAHKPVCADIPATYEVGSFEALPGILAAHFAGKGAIRND